MATTAMMMMMGARELAGAGDDREGIHTARGKLNLVAALLGTMSVCVCGFLPALFNKLFFKKGSTQCCPVIDNGNAAAAPAGVENGDGKVVEVAVAKPVPDRALGFFREVARTGMGMWTAICYYSAFAGKPELQQTM